MPLKAILNKYCKLIPLLQTNINRIDVNFTAISWREQVSFQWDDDEVHFVLDQHAELDFHSASSLKQQSAGRHGCKIDELTLNNNYSN
jgi:hypothetical protein